MGYSDVEIDEIATVCMAHFISTSGVKDLNSKADWIECFDRIDSAVYAYNNENRNGTISFNRNALENDDYLSILATETFVVQIEFNINCENFAKSSYEEFRIECTNEYSNISIIYPWEK